MLLWLATFLEQYVHGFHVVHYLTFRAILSVLTAFGLSMLFGPMLIRYLSENHLGQMVRDDGPSTHLQKAGTPTMGGALILLTVTLTTLLWSDWDNIYIWLVLSVMIAFGMIGFLDDYLKYLKANSKGLSAKAKIFWQLVSAILPVCFLYFYAHTPEQTQVLIPYLKNVSVDIGIGFIPFALLVILGTSNSVNLTDGLDGLAILPVVMVGGALGVFAYLSGNANFSHYLMLPFIQGVGEVIVFCAALVGAGLGFLWFNTYPAQVFMGDVGALGIGAALGMIAVVVREEFVLMIMGGLFVVEALSVMLQVASFKLTGKRIFRMAPLHHHYELKGWPEPRVIVRFWILTFLLVMIGLAAIKLR